MSLLKGSAVGALALLAISAASAPAPLPVHVGGRAVVDAEGGLSFGWPGAYFESRFKGNALRLRLDAPADHLRLLVDGREMLVFRRPGLVDARLERLGEGEHVVRLEKLTESQQGGSRFLGFFTAGGGVARPAPARARQIEFIGDSYTVGYGNVSPTRICTGTEVHDRTDTQQAFGPIVARHYDADYRIHASSGFGIVRNYNGGSRELSLPILYRRLKPGDAAPADVAEPGWRPQVIVVNLGTNDFSTPLHADERWRDPAALKAAWRQAYVEFVAGLQARQPQARFILMGSEMFYPEVERVAASLDARAPGRVTILRFTGLDLGACDWHPSLADHRKLAALIEAEIDRLAPFGAKPAR